MKKIGIIFFIIALIIGVGLAKAFSLGNSSLEIFSIKLSRGVSGSGKTSAEKRDVADFRAVDVSNAIQVEIVAQKDFSVEVEADDNILPLIKTEVRGGFLRIESEQRYNSKNPVIVRISAPNIEELEVSGASKVNLTDLNNESLNIDASGASKISIKGTTANLTVDASGASKIDAENLKSENASIEASGASGIQVSVNGDLKANASGASKIVYAGTPRNFENKTSGASSVRQK